MFKKEWRLVFVQIFCAAVVVVGFSLLLRYSFTPGRPISAATIAVDRQALPLNPRGHTLVLVAHPWCPCTAASLDEFQEVLAESPTKVTTYIVFVHLKGEPPMHDDRSLLQAARSIPGVHVVIDEGGAIAGSLGATTSGQVLMFDSQGHLEFEGGITASRGHAGSNYGVDSILALLNNRKPIRTHTPVFGCSLLGENDTITK